MKNPSPGSCFGGFGRPGEGTVEIGAALTTTMRRGREDREFHIPCSFVEQIIRKEYHMDSISSEDANETRRRWRLTTEIKESLRELRLQLALLNHQVRANLALKDVDLDCLDLINLHGPLSPSALARHAGLHPATMTGIIDRLERGGWVTRERDPSDRRAVVIRTLPERGAELFRLYGGMNRSMDQICAGYTGAELELLADFVRRTATAGRSATDELAVR
jgi:DNA-binding MarR family transcriptional regulator